IGEKHPGVGSIQDVRTPAPCDQHVCPWIIGGAVARLEYAACTDLTRKLLAGREVEEVRIDCCKHGDVVAVCTRPLFPVAREHTRTFAAEQLAACSNGFQP